MDREVAGRVPEELLVAGSADDGLNSGEVVQIEVVASVSELENLDRGDAAREVDTSYRDARQDQRVDARSAQDGERCRGIPSEAVVTCTADNRLEASDAADIDAVATISQLDELDGGVTLGKRGAVIGKCTGQ